MQVVVLWLCLQLEVQEKSYRHLQMKSAYPSDMLLFDGLFLQLLEYGCRSRASASPLRHISRDYVCWSPNNAEVRMMAPTSSAKPYLAI
jgi:hypothetical protein